MINYYKLFCAPILLSAVMSLIVTSGSAQTGSRLRATSSYRESTPGILAPSDSAEYKYPSISSGLTNEALGYGFTSGVPYLGSRGLFIYNGQGKKTQWDTELWNTTTTSFDKYSRETYVLDAAGNDTLDLTQQWNTAGTALTNVSRIMRAYNAANYQMFRRSQTWKSATSTWLTTSDLTYYRDGLNRLTTSVSKTWSSSTGNLTSQDSNLFVYNSTNAVTSGTTYKWNIPAATYQPYSRDTFYFNAAGQDSSSLNYKYDLPSATWKLNSRNTTTRSAIGTGTQVITTTESWNAGTASFINSERNVTSYYSFGQQTAWAIQYWSSGTWYAYSLNNSYYEAYSPLAITGTAIGRNIAFTFAPNPASIIATATIHWETPEPATALVTDMQGRILRHYSTKSSKEIKLEIDVADLPAGNYLLTLKGTSGAVATKVFAVHH